jgi:hypothetical protein
MITRPIWMKRLERAWQEVHLVWLAGVRRVGDDAEDAVVLVEVDADIKRPACLLCGLTHSLPFYNIDFMRFRSSK